MGASTRRDGNLVLEFYERTFPAAVGRVPLGAGDVVHRDDRSITIDSVAIVRHEPATVNASLGGLLLFRRRKRPHDGFAIRQGCYNERKNQGLHCPLLVRGALKKARILPKLAEPKLNPATNIGLAQNARLKRRFVRLQVSADCVGAHQTKCRAALLYLNLPRLVDRHARPSMLGAAHNKDEGHNNHENKSQQSKRLDKRHH